MEAGIFLLWVSANNHNVKQPKHHAVINLVIFAQEPSSSNLHGSDREWLSTFPLRSQDPQIQSYKYCTFNVQLQAVHGPLLFHKRISLRKCWL